MDWKEIQRALEAKGFRPGAIDGIPGRRTRAAVVRFQAAHNLTPDGIVGPVTRRALLGPVSGDLEPSWLTVARSKMGLHERRNRGGLMAWLRSDGKTLGDPSRLPWCGDFVETSLALALTNEVLPTNPYLARNWLTFGVKLARPSVGAVAVFWRGSRTGSSGHVGFYVGEDATHYHILGGNQSNMVSIARIARDRLLGFRWPASVPLPLTGPVALTAEGQVTTNEA
ncbi:NlpC/P60 family protein [Pannonibacter sp. SL95]|uniref:NlpC/P60 family protein n=1 Tax=Pannonibacter sp. SL95 TaxID=2995153 RepID=UPI002273591D|nr:TIGR02594 family protein [Pannonibacter sp. SL95]MCY1704472.1 TIGR02594 family protein [Pannonibacter sp. SL95]MCY1707697.1 TIGR02594 family protein [Pannonibacter sp. SL95]